MSRATPESYRFDAYLQALGSDWFSEDDLLVRWLARSSPDAKTVELVDRFGQAVATRYRELADYVERRENLPRLADADPYNRRTTRVVLPEETRRMLSEIHGSGIWRADLDERARYALVYLLNQNGESGVTCSTACTDGLARALRALGGDARSRGVLDRLERATPETWLHGAQFVTEIQGGSDAATNALRAVPAGDGQYALHGQKWFCSNPTADYWLVTARVEGAPDGPRGVSLFCVPRERDGAPNGYRLARLKDKLGTRALATAELDFEGALGWPVGALDAGLRNVVAIVLTTSRIHCVLQAAGATRRAAREASAYARFRSAFGRTLVEHPLVADSVRRLCAAADLAAAGAFATVDAWVAANANPGDAALRLWARILISLAKAVATRASPARIYEAMMLFGGNGTEERFSALPRLWRDSAVIEAWEGPYTLLLSRALGDMARYGVAGREREFLRHGLGDHCRDGDVAELAAILAAPAAAESALRFAELAPALYRRFEEKALAELRAQGGGA
jgi:alkylation response protein AidB-like acyl-CoA dehydrogenase